MTTKHLNGNSDDPVTQAQFNEALQIINATFERMATKEDLAEGLARLQERIDQGFARVLKVVESTEGRLKEMADHEERITHLEDKVFSEPRRS